MINPKKKVNKPLPDNVTVVDFSKKNSNRPNEDSERIERLRNSLNILFNRRGLSNK